LNKKELIIIGVAVFWLAAGFFLYKKSMQGEDKRFITYTADTREQDIRLFWKDSTGKDYRNITNLLAWAKQQNINLDFVMNGGMYHPDFSPVGLYIEQGHLIHVIDTGSGEGNFYLKPNGIFYITKTGDAGICSTPDFKDSGAIAYATQSGPVLLSGGVLHPGFKPGSANLQVRNGVGILPDHKVIFVLSKQPISFYDFATYFKELGCKDALYLDGMVSRAYLPAKQWAQKDGDLGVLIGISTKTIR
jgi:uncharacterized protein YigE (DUF2233 family)